MHFNVVLHARRPRDHHAGDGAWPIPFQALPFYRQWNGRHRLAAHHVRDPASLEVLIRNLPRPCCGGRLHSAAWKSISTSRVRTSGRAIRRARVRKALTSFFYSYNMLIICNLNIMQSIIEFRSKQGSVARSASVELCRVRDNFNATNIGCRSQRLFGQISPQKLGL